LKQDGLVRTEHGRAEILLLGACTAMWIGEQSSLHLLSGNPADARIELLRGSAVIPVSAPPKDSQLAVVTKSATVLPGRKGFYRFDMGPPRLEVTSGAAIARWSDETVAVGSKHAVLLYGSPNVIRLDPRTQDALDDWSKTRAAILVRASSLDRQERIQASRVDAAAAQAAGDQPRPVLDGEYPVISSTTNGPPPPSPIPDIPRRALPIGFAVCGGW
jgi:hypothetical protein